MEYMAKQDIDLPPKNMNGGAEIELGPAVGNTIFLRKYGITGVLYETKTIKDFDTLMGDTGQIVLFMLGLLAGYEDRRTFDEDWFANGFPDLETVNKNDCLQDTILALAEEGRCLDTVNYNTRFAQAWEGESNN